jgi:hypothetical protein
VIRFLVAVVLVSLSIAGCSSDSGLTASPITATQTPTSTASEVRTPAPPPLALGQDEAWFHGVVTGMQDGRDVDGPLTMTVQVTDDLGVQALGVGNTAGVFVACSFCIPCLGQWGDDIDTGYDVEVLAKWVEGYLSICDSPELYARPFGPTPMPSPRYTGPATPSPTPTP